MSRTIMDLNLGTEVWLHETIGGAEETVPYILVRKDSQGGVLLRKTCSEKKRMNPTNTVVYDGCEADVYLNDSETGFLSRFPAGELTCFQSRSISTFEYGDAEARSISRRCYLLSYGDVFSAVAYNLEPETGILYTLMDYNNTFDANDSRIATLEGSAVYWWLRSPYSTARFYDVYSNGSSDSSVASYAGNALRPALNVAPATIVSDEGADKIYLITTGVTRTVGFKAKVRELNNRPAKAIVRFTANNLNNISVQLTNNYGDATPVWVDATAMTEITFNNTTKETEKWQLGIKCYGETTGYGYFDEPYVFFTY